MATISNNLTIEKGTDSNKVGSQVKSHANDPFVLKKVEEATKTIQRLAYQARKRNRYLK